MPIRTAILAALLLVLGACATTPEISSFYSTTKAELQGRPGSLIRLERYIDAPHGATAYKVLYRSTGLRGEPIAVSGVVLIPDTPAPPGGRKIVAWAHSTTGVVRGCAPTLYGSVFRNMAGLGEILRRGYIVAATDYPGLGTKGPHPFMIGVSAARAVLDSVRAARAIPGAQASRRFAAWGHSQGGHAVLWTGQLAPRYAPELTLVGVAAAAPATDLGRLFELDRDELAGKVLTAMTLLSWSRAFGYSTDYLVAQKNRANYRQLGASCFESMTSELRGYIAEFQLPTYFLLADPTRIDPWRRQLRRNIPGLQPTGTPVFLIQGLADKIVSPKVTEAFAASLCRNGTDVRLVLLPAVNHFVIADRGAQTAVAWMAHRLEGIAASTTCRLDRR